LRLFLKTAFIATSTLMVACDPGLSIRQVDPQKQLSSGTATLNAQVVVQVERRDQLIGSTWYMTKVKVTNVSRSPMTVFSVDLSVQNKLYTNKAPEVVYPLPIQPGGVKILGVYFALDDDIQKTFQQGADLWVHYRIGGEDGTANAHLTSGPL
jgi:hypothetical protein